MIHPPKVGGVCVAKKTDKADVTVEQFAEEIGVKPQRLLDQFKEAAINIAYVSDVITQEQRRKLLRYLQQHHGTKQDTSPEKIVFHRAKTSRIKLTHGEGKMVSVRVVKKRTLVKRHLTEEVAASSISVSRRCLSLRLTDDLGFSSTTSVVGNTGVSSVYVGCTTAETSFAVCGK